MAEEKGLISKSLLQSLITKYKTATNQTDKTMSISKITDEISSKVIDVNKAASKISKLDFKSNKVNLLDSSNAILGSLTYPS